MHPRIRIAQGDITKAEVDAIVNAANSALQGGGGVDGAIHRAAGPQLAEACRTLGRCATGDAKITPGFGLRARWVIHTVGPVWQGGQHGEQEMLAQCYRRSLALAARHQVATLAFPSISTGRYRFPLDLAAPIALREIGAALAENPALAEVHVVCFESQVYETYMGLSQAR